MIRLRCSKQRNSRALGIYEQNSSQQTIVVDITVPTWDGVGMKRATIFVRPYSHRAKHKFVVDLRAYGKGRKFFRTRADAEAEALRQKTLLERYSRELVGLSQREMSDIIAVRNRLAEYGKELSDAADFYIDHLERIRRCRITVTQLAAEVLEAKRKDGLSARYLKMLRLYLKRFCHDFGNRLIADITVEELDSWLRALPLSPKSRSNYRIHIGVLFGYAARRRII